MAHACRLRSLQVAPLFPTPAWRRSCAKLASSSTYAKGKKEVDEADGDLQDFAVSSGISRPLSEILKQINKKVPDTLVKSRHENGFTSKYIPWHVVNRIMNLHAPEWSGEGRSITYSADAKSVNVVYRVTLYGTDAEVYLPMCVLELNENERYSADAKSVNVVYRVTLYGTDAEMNNFFCNYAPTIAFFTDIAPHIEVTVIYDEHPNVRYAIVCQSFM